MNFKKICFKFHFKHTTKTRPIIVQFYFTFYFFKAFEQGWAGAGCFWLLEAGAA